MYIKIPCCYRQVYDHVAGLYTLVTPDMKCISSLTCARLCQVNICTLYTIGD